MIDQDQYHKMLSGGTFEFNITGNSDGGGMRLYEEPESNSEDSDRFWCESVASQSHSLNEDKWVWFTRNALTEMQIQYENMGMPILLNHDSDRSLGLGKTTAARVINDELIVRFYLLRGVDNHISDTDQVIRLIMEGILDSVSIRVSYRKLNCSICDAPVERAMFGLMMTCSHFPGLEFTVEQPNGTKEKERAYLIADSVDVHELSLVAVPSERTAKVTNRDLGENSLDTMEDVMSTGTEKPESQAQLSQRVGVLENQLAAKTAELEAEQLKSATLQQTNESLQSSVDTLKAGRDELQIKVDGLESDVAAFASVQQQLDEVLDQERADALNLFQAAFTGSTKEEIEDTRQLLQGQSTLAAIRVFSTAWRTVRDARLPAGRQTHDGHDSETKTATGRAPGRARSY